MENELRNLVRFGGSLWYIDLEAPEVLILEGNTWRDAWPNDGDLFEAMSEGSIVSPDELSSEASAALKAKLASGSESS